ncbi:hypothetical protein HG531_013488 [Fusarium graminearum]|nr:hypothetical protein HG531_013488 [Fusarium graminearum]
MVHHASDAEPISTQQEALKAPPSKKPSAYVFDSNGDTRIILSTYMAQSFKWEADKIWIEPEKPTWANFKTKSRGRTKEGNADSSGLRRITASDWDPEAFKIVLTIMHGYHRDVPGLLSLEQLAKVAMIVNYYDCLESVEIYRTIWLGLWSGMPTIYGRDCVLYVLLSWVLSNPVPFQTMTQLALRHSQRLIEAEDLPIPADIFKEIDIARQSAIAEVFSAIYELLDRLQDEQECSFECSSMLLGVLTKELGNHRILYPRITPPYNGFSIEGLKKMIKRLKRPSWYQEPKSPRHSCSIQDKLSVSLSKLESKLPVFNLQDFQSVKNDRRV